VQSGGLGLSVGVSNQLLIGRRYQHDGKVLHVGTTIEPWLGLAVDYRQVTYEIDPPGRSNELEREADLVYLTPRFGLNFVFRTGEVWGIALGGHVGAPILVNDDLEDEFGANVTTDMTNANIQWGALLDFIVEPRWQNKLEFRLGLEVQ